MFLFISVAIYLGIAAALIAMGKPDGIIPNDNNLQFNELLLNYEGLPELQNYQARDGASLSYRYYPSQSDKVVILLHGSGYHGRYFFPLARFISTQNLAHVYTPDLRGHGPAPERRGDVDYIGQFEDDIADLIAVVHKQHPNARVIIGGHSSGGGLAVRFGGSPYGKDAHAYILLAPFLKYNAPIMRPQSGGWAQPNIKRIVGLVMLNKVGIRWFNDLPVIQFNMPEAVRDGTETLSYTYRLNTAFAPANYIKDLQTLKAPIFVAVGTADEAFYADRFDTLFSQCAADARIQLLDGVTHMGVVVGPEIQPVVKNWLENLN